MWNMGALDMPRWMDVVSMCVRALAVGWALYALFVGGSDPSTAVVRHPAYFTLYPLNVACLLFGQCTRIDRSMCRQVCKTW